MTVHSWQKLVFVLLFFLAFLSIWILITNKFPNVQRTLHKLPGPLACCFQWYSLLLMMVFGLCADMVGNISYNDFYMTDWLNPAYINATYAENNLPQGEIDDISIPTWLRILSLTSPFAGLVALVILFVHFVQQCGNNVALATRNGDPLKWKFSVPEEMLLLVIVMPAIFILMSIRSTSRMWMVMTAFHVGEDKKTDLALFDENFELASVCQYIVVFMFARLCFYVMRMESASKDITNALQLVGFQGVYGWILVGCVHSVLLFFTSYMGHNYNEYGMTEAQVDSIHVFEPKIAFVSSIFSLQCTYNMFVICKLPTLVRTLGNPTMKFNGTKIMLLLGPNQLKILLALSANVNKSAAIDKAQSFLNLSTERAMLLHSSLMCYECLAVVVLNFVSWSDVMNGVGEDIFYKKELNEPLLDSN